MIKISCLKININFILLTMNLITLLNPFNCCIKKDQLNQLNSDIFPSIYNKFLIIDYKKKWVISDKIFYVNKDRNKIIFLCHNKKKKEKYLAKISKINKNEIEVLKHLHKNDFIVNIENIYYNKYGSIQIMKHYHNGDLSKYICKNMINKNVIIKHLIHCVKSIHEQKIYHRDIKLENFLIQEKPKFNILLTDFELSSKSLYNNSLQGTILYMCPECFINKITNNQKRDLWALGVVVFYIIYNNFPFIGKSFNEIKNNIINNKLNNDIKLKKNSKYNKLLYSLLEYKIEKRELKVFM